MCMYICFSTFFYLLRIILCYSHLLVFRRGLFIIDGNGVLRQITMNDLAVSELSSLLYILFGW